MEIGTHLRYLRERKGLTLEEVGNYLGVNKATVQRYESGEIDIKRIVAIQLAEILGSTPSEIMGWGTQLTFIDMNEQNFIATPLERQIIQQYRDMPEMREAVHKILGITVQDDRIIRTIRKKKNRDDNKNNGDGNKHE